MTHRTGAIACPTCGYIMDAHDTFQPSDAVPSDGDLSVCLQCTEFLVYADNLTTLRKLSDEEWLELPLDNRIELKRIRGAMQKFKARKRSTPGSSTS